MQSFAQRFQFIAHALRADGPFRPSDYIVGTYAGTGTTLQRNESYLVRYPRESDRKYTARNELAFFSSPLARAASRFAGYLSTRAPTRDLPHALYKAIADDVDGKGNALDVFASEFVIEAKARGSMLMLVDMPKVTGANQGEQIAARRAPYWTPIAPEAVTAYQLGADGKFDFVEFAGRWRAEPQDDPIDCIWRFDRDGWKATEQKSSAGAGGRLLEAGEHPLGECPVLIFTEKGDFPCFGPFSAIADLARRLFNLDSELDEILRAQTFSLLTMQVPGETTPGEKVAMAQLTGETIGTNNLMLHSGSTPAFIAPPDGPAKVYLERIAGIREQIDEIGLNAGAPLSRESGIALAMRFAAVNGELARFAQRMEDFERRAWDLSRRWLKMTQAPQIQWPRDFNLADVEQELRILAEMRATGMPEEAIAEQQRRVVAIQFAGLDQEALDAVHLAIDERLHEPRPPGNVVPLRPDPNASVREAIVRTLNG